MKLDDAIAELDRASAIRDECQADGLDASNDRMIYALATVVKLLAEEVLELRQFRHVHYEAASGNLKDEL